MVINGYDYRYNVYSTSDVEDSIEIFETFEDASISLLRLLIMELIKKKEDTLDNFNNKYSNIINTIERLHAVIVNGDSIGDGKYEGVII